MSLSDPSIGDKFSVERLGTSGRGLVSVPSIVHGAPETAEVHFRLRCFDSFGLIAVILNNIQVSADLACKEPTLSWAMQESRETLFRLQRMAGFESQNFDPQVAILCTCIALQSPRQDNDE